MLIRLYLASKVAIIGDVVKDDIIWLFTVIVPLVMLSLLLPVIRSVEVVVPVIIVLCKFVMPVTFNVGHDTILLKVAFVKLNDKAFEPLKDNYKRHH